MSKPYISLTSFIDVILKSGTPKANEVRKLKKRGQYDPAGDCYKRLREKIIELHSHNLAKDELDEAATLVHRKYKDHYNDNIIGYKRWLGSKEFDWITPPKSRFLSKKVEIGVNPELGLMISGKPHFIKLYFKVDDLKKNRIVHINQMMEEVLRPISPKGAVMSVMDVRRGKLFISEGFDNFVSSTLRAELAYIDTIWDEL